MELIGFNLAGYTLSLGQMVHVNVQFQPEMLGNHDRLKREGERERIEVDIADGDAYKVYEGFAYLYTFQINMDQEVHYEEVVVCTGSSESR